MKHYLSSLILVIVSVFAIIGCSSDSDEKFKVIEKVITKEIKTPFSVDDYPQAKEYLEEEIKSCGKGVVLHECEGDVCVPEENNCAYAIKADYDFFTRFKTGYIPNKKKTGTGDYWVMPTAAEIAAVPEKWSIRDYGKAVDFHAAKQVNSDCWANATANVFSLLASAVDKVLTFMSVQAVIDCSGEGSASGGGYMTAKNMLVKYGIVTRDKYPYNGMDHKCKYSQAELAKGLDYKLKGAPWVGSSLMYSKGNKGRAVPTAAMIQAAMIRDQSPALVTVYAYDISGPGIYNNCSAINYGGNHMVGIEGFYKADGKDIAQVTNSWGPNHGVNGVSNIQWECGGAGRLNRGLGVEAATYQYDAKCAMPVPETGPDQVLIKLSPGAGVLLGKKAKEGEVCSWLPKEGLSNPESCETFASPSVSTEYHLTVKNSCGESTSMVQVDVYGKDMKKDKRTNTPFGIVTE